MADVSLSSSQHKASQHQKIKSGRGWILAVAIIQTIFAIILSALYLFDENSLGLEATEVNITIATLAIIALLFWGCWFWAKKHPFPAALSALILYVTIHAADAIVDPTNLGKGVLLKLLFVAGLTQAVTSAYKLKKAAQD